VRPELRLSAGVLPARQQLLLIALALLRLLLLTAPALIPSSHG